MKEAKITIDLKNLNWYFLKGDQDDEYRIIKNYLDGDLQTSTINEMIKFISDTELSLYTHEDLVCRYLKTFDFSPVPFESVRKMQTNGIFRIDEAGDELYFSNFVYQNDRFLTRKEAEDFTKVEDGISCLVILKREFLSFYFMEEYYKELILD